MPQRRKGCCVQRSEGSNQCFLCVYTFYLKLALGVKSEFQPPWPKAALALSHHPWDILNHMHPILLTKMELMTGRQRTESLKHRPAGAGAISRQGSGFSESLFGGNILNV